MCVCVLHIAVNYVHTLTPSIHSLQLIISTHTLSDVSPSVMCTQHEACFKFGCESQSKTRTPPTHQHPHTHITYSPTSVLAHPHPHRCTGPTLIHVFASMSTSVCFPKIYNSPPNKHGNALQILGSRVTLKVFLLLPTFPPLLHPVVGPGLCSTLYGWPP